MVKAISTGDLAAGSRHYVAGFHIGRLLFGFPKQLTAIGHAPSRKAVIIVSGL
jgi:hypothetical protein